MFRPLLAGLLLLALAGCATPEKRPFQSPRSGPTAEVSFRNATPGRTEVAIFEDAAECTGRRFLPDLLIGEQQTVRVPAGKPLAFGIRYIVPNTTPQRYCEVLASFEVEPNGRYEVIIRSGSDRPCTAHVRQLVGTATDMRTLLRAPVKSRNEDGPFCFPIQ
ncbi:MAG: hypothetical protein GX093_12940 [Xanthomonadaceae bacterium]|nr:hypothetical protein [Xanthomonadaceae bacterium]